MPIRDEKMMAMWQEKGKYEVSIGNTDLHYDVDRIDHLLKLPNSLGIIMHLSYPNEGIKFVYRPTTPLETEKDVVKTIRQFLGVAAVLQGRLKLTAIKHEKNIPNRAIDFNELYQALIRESVILEKD